MTPDQHADAIIALVRRAEADADIFGLTGDARDAYLMERFKPALDAALRQLATQEAHQP
jgi:hypothetical protein